MTSEPQHSTPASQSPAAPVKHPSFEKLTSWAETNGCLQIIHALYWVLGMGPNDPGVANLVAEIDFPESRDILDAWQGLPVVQHLINLRRQMSGFPFRDYYSRLHSGSADQTKRSFSHLREKDFLLAMITNPLTDAAGGDRFGNVSPEVLRFRRMLRLWLVLEALHRLERQKVAFDTNISSAARKITIGAESNSWSFIDELLGRVAKRFPNQIPAFSDFKNALTENAHQLAGESKQRESKLFFNAIHAIGIDTSSPVDSQSLPPDIHSPASILGSPLSFTIEPGSSTKWVSDEGQQYDLPIFDSDTDDVDLLDGETFFVEVEKNQSLAEKAISSKSVYLQTAEASHYLPWSLQSPLPPEISYFQQWIETNLEAGEQQTQIGAAFCWLASRLGRSLQMIRSLPIASDAQSEWTLDPTFKILSRYGIRRSSAWKPADDQKGLVEPFAETLQLDVSRISEILHTAARGRSFESLGAIWDWVASGITLESWFRQARPESLERINSTQIFNFLGNEIYEKSGDHHLARLVSSHPQSGLPGALSYASWDIVSIEKNLPLKPTGCLDPWVHVAGSLLVPIENILHEKITVANEQLERGEMDLVQWHNHFTEYVVWALYAATGSRPLADPFESINHFNLDHQFVFINDKNDLGLHSGRITPLPANAIELVRVYLTHLEALSKRLLEIHPALSDEIAAARNGESKKIPLFFRLNPELEWKSLSVSGSGTLFDWELPPNLFRHRYSQQLYKEGVPREVIDGWLGHAERGTATYGDYSPRSWQDDWKKYRDKVDGLFESLPFRVFPVNTAPPLLVDCQVANKKLATRTYGQRLREKKSRERIKRATAEADEIIGRLDLTSSKEAQEEKLNLVVEQLLKRETGMAHPYAALRFSRLVRFLETKNIDHQLKIRRYAHYNKPERSQVRFGVSQAVTQFERLSVWALDLMKKNVDSTLQKAERLVLATFQMAITKRISYQKLLGDLIQGQHYRVIQHDSSYYIEYSENLDPDNRQAPVQRHQVNHRIASLLAAGQGVKQPYRLTGTVPVILDGVRQILGGADSTPLNQLLEKLCNTVDQTSQVQLPGMVAAVLSGRVISTSLPLLDFVRINQGVAKTWPDLIASQGDAQSKQNISSLPLSGRQPETDQQRLLHEAQNFRREMTKNLLNYAPAQAKQFAKKLQKNVREYEGRVSNSLILLGFWIAEVINAGKNPGRGRKFQPLAANTIKTYFSSLVGPFAGLAYEVDMLELDSDELTDLYADMIELRRSQGHRLDYFSERLLSFQRWAQRYGVSTPDYTELRIIDDSRSVNAGCLSDSDYQATLSIIDQKYKQAVGVNNERGLMLSWMLLLCYRFGLRSKEATGLRFRDFCSYAGYRWVLVRNNRKRQLKSNPSRRAVPLAFELTQSEELIIDQILDRYHLIAGQESNGLLLCDLDDGQLVPSNNIPSLGTEIIQLLKTITGNPAIVLHHCRHSFHNRMVAILLDLPSPTAKKLNADLTADSIRQLVMGRHYEASRRSPAALTCLMGHRHPETGMYSYNHLLFEWADDLTPLPTQRARKIPGALDTCNLVDIDLQMQVTEISAVDYETPTLVNLLSVLRRVSQGKTFDQAGELENLNPAVTRVLSDVFKQATDKMRFKKRGENTFLSGMDYPDALIKYIGERGWRRMIEQVRNASTPHPKIIDGISVRKLVSLVGANRQILMRKKKHFHLIKALLNAFEITPEYYSIFPNKKNERIAKLISEQGFGVAFVENDGQDILGVQLDVMSAYKSGKVDATYHQYAALILKKNKTGLIRNSYELAVIVLALGVLQLTAQAEPSS